MKKFVVKTTKEYTYDNQGRIAKEIITEESYEQEIYTGGLTTTTGTSIKTADINPNIYTAKGVPSSSITFGNDGSVKVSGGDIRVDNAKADKSYNITVNANLPKNVGDIMDEVKATLAKSLDNTKGRLF
jgi:hypothetical protein